MIYACFESWLSRMSVRILGVGVVVVLFALMVGVTGTVAAQSAPDCSTVTYEGEGTDANPYEVGNVDQLQCIKDQNLNADYQVVSDIDATETVLWNDGTGFERLGEDGTPPFTGKFDGGDFNITDLTIDGPFERRNRGDPIGLFGVVGDEGIIENVNLKEVDINASFNVGALVGSNRGIVRHSSVSGTIEGDVGVGGLAGSNGGIVRQSSSSGNIQGEGGGVGGLVGNNGGMVTESYSTGDVTATDFWSAGGLVGENNGIIEQSHATGGVVGIDNVGGLVGGIRRGGEVTGSYSTGNVDGNERVGGLVGFNSGSTITGSHSVGDVNGVEGVGGLVGWNAEGTVSKSYSTGNTDGKDFVGGFVGFNFGTVTESYATGDANGSVQVGGLIGRNGQDGDGFGPGTVSESYATGSVTATGFNIGGLVALNDIGTVSESYWDTEITGQSSSDGGTGLTTSEMTGTAATSNMQGFDFTNTWETVTNPDDYPILAWQSQSGPTPANFEVTIDSTNSPVTEGETLSITATVENTGGQQDTQTITATAGSLGSITRTVTLDAGESKTETVSVPTNAGDTGTYTVTVESENDTATTTVTVEDDDGGGDLFPNPLPGFNSPPTNTGQLDPNLYEDIDGDGDGEDPTQSVTLWTNLVLNPQDFDSLSQEQVDALDWNGDGQLTPADAVNLWTEQVLVS